MSEIKGARHLHTSHSAKQGTTPCQKQLKLGESAWHLSGTAQPAQAIFGKIAL
jgi:hypothetical protein